MRHGERLPLLTEILESPRPAEPTEGPGTASAQPAQAQREGPDAPRPATAELLPLSEQMARAVLELELEQALREVLEPRLSVLLRETASELALRLEPRMREWLRERGSS